LPAASVPKGFPRLADVSLAEPTLGHARLNGGVSVKTLHPEARVNVHFLRFWRLLSLLALAQIATGQNPASIRLIGVGTTSSLPVYSKWFEAFEKTRPDLHFVYMPSGSGTGIEMVTSGAADFGGTDVPMTDKQLARAKALQFATLLVAIVPIYNLPGVLRPLKFSPQALAGIYLGTITRWNDPAISGPNPEMQLPATNIAVIHSAGGRGSTYIWSDYLSKVSVEWRTRIGRGISIEWPVGKEGEGNGNVARMVKETPNSIGFVELVYAERNQLSCGQVQNAAGNFVGADASSTTAAAAATAKAMPSGSRASLTNPPGEKSYPISSFTWILVSSSMESTTKQAALKEFLRWTLNEGQTYVEAAGFARLPKAILEQELSGIERIP
jgi:phosphate transport system substrate-binding protein